MIIRDGTARVSPDSQHRADPYIGGVAMVIPSSPLALLLRSLAEVIPGLLLAILYVGYLMVACTLRPNLAPPAPIETLSLRERLVPLVRDVLPLMGIVIVVVGSILGWFAIPSDSAALGCLATLIAVVFYRALDIGAIHAALAGTVRTSALILIIISGSITFSQILSYSGASRQFVDAILEVGLGPMVIVAKMLLGTLMDQVSIMMITPPFTVQSISPLATVGLLSKTSLLGILPIRLNQSFNHFLSLRTLPMSWPLSDFLVDLI